VLEWGSPVKPDPPLTVGSDVMANAPNSSSFVYAVVTGYTPIFDAVPDDVEGLAAGSKGDEGL
jgi:hypothetical protein